MGKLFGTDGIRGVVNDGLDAMPVSYTHLDVYKRQGVGTPSNIIEGVARGVDFFDCVMPARNARHAKLFTWSGALNIRNEKYKLDERPIDPDCDCPVCRSFSLSLIHI